MFQLLTYVQDDLRSCQAKLVELRAQIAAADIPDKPQIACNCGLRFKSTARLAEHVYHTHGGVEPPHWVEAEERSVA